MNRSLALTAWVKKTLGHEDFALSLASSDASFRRYFRVSLGHTTLIVMDAPPDHEDCAPYVKVAQLFLAAGVNVPEIFAHDLHQGFILMSDLGPTTYLDALHGSNADEMYEAAIDALIKIQLASRANILSEYDSGPLMREMALFPDWYIARHLKIVLSEAQERCLRDVFELIQRNALGQGQVYVHRDYHSRNLMYTSPNPGILDFQDALFGPVAYDLVSLFKDAYISWEEKRIRVWCEAYWKKAQAARLPVPADFEVFYRDFEWMGVQRHLKVLGIFARLFHRDGKAGYLKDMPLVMAYLRAACARYKELHNLLALLDEMSDLSPQAAVRIMPT